LRKWIEEGDLDRLSQTDAAQPLILIDSLVKERVLRERGIVPTIVAGHSLGEYAALVSAGVLRPEEALTVVIERGRLMAGVSGGMAAIIKLPLDRVREICEESGPGVSVANVNGPTQVVISGNEKTLLSAMAAAEQAGGRAIRLRVSGPFHSSLMEGAQDDLAPMIESLPFCAPTIPVVSSVSGKVEPDPMRLKHLLLTQITACVSWVDVMETLIQEGITCAVEVGPGKTLVGLGRRMTSKVRFVTFEEAINGAV
jgi:[acyl-carrier-protein] S-malonyltransferase